jgi:hypothetical protein
MSGRWPAEADTDPYGRNGGRGGDRRRHRVPTTSARAATGSDSAIHCAALLGGASQNLADFRGRQRGRHKHTCWMRPSQLGLRRVVAVSTGTFFDTAEGLDREDAPLSKEPSGDPYTITKMAAFQDAMARAAAGQDVVSTHPGAIFGPSPVVSNALGKTSFNRVLVPSSQAGGSSATCGSRSAGSSPTTSPAAASCPRSRSLRRALHARRAGRGRRQHRHRVQPPVRTGRTGPPGRSTSTPRTIPSWPASSGRPSSQSRRKRTATTGLSATSTSRRPPGVSVTIPQASTTVSS